MLIAARYLGIVILPALLIWIEGYGYMSSDYTGLHKFQWGYFLATSLAVAVLISLFSPSQKPQRSDPAFSYFDVTALALFSATALGLAANAWFFEKRIGNILYRMLPLAFILFSVANSALADATKRKNDNIDNLFTRIAFAGLVAFIAAHFAEHASTYQQHFSRTSQISENLSQSQRAFLRSIVDPLFFAGLTALTVATAGSLRSLFKKLRSNAKRCNLYSIPILTAVMALPSYRLFRLGAGENSNHFFGLDIIYLSFISFFASLTLASILFLYFSLIDLRDHVHSIEKGFFAKLLLISAIYSLTPFMSGGLGNLPVFLFWAAMSVFVATVILMPFQKDQWTYYPYKIAQIIAFFAVTCMFLSEFALEASGYTSTQVFQPIFQTIYNALYDMRRPLQGYGLAAASTALIISQVTMIAWRPSQPSQR